MTRALSTRASSLGLFSIGALHVVWATGSSWPMRDGPDLADAAGGRAGGKPHSPAACLTVAGLLAAAAAFVAGHPRRIPALSRLGSAGVVTVLLTRGAFGLAGHTDILSPGATSERFRTLDRRYYSPLCLALGAAALPAVGRPDS